MLTPKFLRKSAGYISVVLFLLFLSLFLFSNTRDIVYAVVMGCLSAYFAFTSMFLLFSDKKE